VCMFFKTNSLSNPISITIPYRLAILNPLPDELFFCGGQFSMH